MPYLSICIPTYNRGEILQHTIEKCILYKGDDIEIIVVDNASSDQTSTIVNSIDDHRIKYYKNEHNIGYYNLIKVMEYASSKWAFLLSDEDEINVNALKKLIALLKKHEGCGMTCVSYAMYGIPDMVYSTELKKAGFSAVNRILLHTYMSGKIFNTDCLCSELDSFDEEYLARRFNREYCWLELALTLLKKYDLLTVDNVVVNHNIEGKGDVSFGSPYTTHNRIQEMCGIISLTNKMGFTLEEKKQLFFRILVWTLKNTTVNYTWLSSCEKQNMDWTYTTQNEQFNFESIWQSVRDSLINHASEIGYIDARSIQDTEEYRLIENKLKADCREESIQNLKLSSNEVSELP